MNVLELFAGSRSLSKVAEKLGHNTFTSDINNFDKIDYVTNIMDFNPKKVPFQPDFIWASVPCYTFSVASIGHHWKGGNRSYTPKTSSAYMGLAIAKKTIEIINHFNPKYYYIENPRGLLRKMEFMQDLPRHTVWYCQYGDDRAKPTDLWTNDKSWIPKPVCKNGNKDCHHQPAPRGSRTGTQGLKGNYERSIVPKDLCYDILKDKDV
jgi:hypothetical protein